MTTKAQPEETSTTMAGEWSFERCVKCKSKIAHASFYDADGNLSSAPFISIASALAALDEAVAQKSITSLTRDALVPQVLAADYLLKDDADAAKSGGITSRLRAVLDRLRRRASEARNDELEGEYVLLVAVRTSFPKIDKPGFRVDGSASEFAVYISDDGERVSSNILSRRIARLVVERSVEFGMFGAEHVEGLMAEIDAFYDLPEEHPEDPPFGE